MAQVFAEVGQSLQQIGGDCPAGWIEMVGARPDDNSIAKADGTWRTPASPTVESERERARAVMNPLRDTFLNRLSGIAIFSEDEAVKVECATLRAALLDITKDEAFLVAATYSEMEIALMNRYRVIANTASETIRNVFRELEI